MAAVVTAVTSTAVVQLDDADGADGADIPDGVEFAGGVEPDRQARADPGDVGCASRRRR